MTFSDFNIDIPQGRTTGQVYAICPQCSHDRKKKSQKCLGVNLDQGIWHCNHCNWKGSIHKKIYSLPKWENKTTLSDAVLAWFQKRNISQDTLIKMKVTEEMQYMPQLEKVVKVICFNYFRDGKLVNIKYRCGE